MNVSPYLNFSLTLSSYNNGTMKKLDLSVEFNKLNAQKHKKLERVATFRAGQSEGGAESIGRMADGSELAKKNLKVLNDKEKRARRRILRQLEQHRRWLLETMEKIQDQIDELTAHMDEHARNIEVLEEAIEQYRIDGEFELDEDGYPMDERLKQLIKDYEAATSEIWDADADKAIEILRSILNGEQGQFELLSNERSKAQANWDELNEQYQATEENIHRHKNGEYLLDSDIDVLNELNTTSVEVSTPQQVEVNLEALPILKP
jgi:chromosome segregation ATPase